MGVAEDEADPVRLAHDHAYALLLGLHAQRIHAHLDQAGDQHAGAVERERAVLALPQVEDVVDRAQQPPAVGVEPVEVLHGLLRQGAGHAALHVLHCIDHRGQRGAQLVGDVGDEFEPRPVQGLEPLDRVAQLLLRAHAFGGVAYKEAELAFGIEIHGVDGDLGGKRRAVGTRAVGLDYGVKIAFEIAADGVEQSGIGTGDAVNDRAARKVVLVGEEELQRAVVEVEDHALQVGDQHGVVDAGEQLVVGRVAVGARRAPRNELLRCARCGAACRGWRARSGPWRDVDARGASGM